MKLRPFPFVENPASVPEDGMFLKTPSFCLHANRGKCEKHYRDIYNLQGFHICPYGFSSFVGNLELDKTIYTGLKIRGSFNRAKLKLRIHEDFLPLMREDAFRQIIANAQVFSSDTQSSAAELAELKRKDEDKREFLNFVVHEIRKLNLQTKRCSEELSKELEKGQNASNEFLMYRVNNIFGSSSLVSVRLDAYDFGQNPDLITSGEKNLVGIYKKFDKVKRCLSAMSSQRKLEIEFSGQSFLEWEAYQVFDILPFLLFENAIKYSPRNQIITVQFSESIDNVLVLIESLGPHVIKEELHRLCEPRFRGKYASAHEKSGTGYGLYLAKLICDIHKIDLKIESDQKLTSLNGVPFSTFRVSLNFQK